MTLKNAELLMDDIVSKRKAKLASKIQRYPATNFRASDISECDRCMVYSILDWDKKSLHDEGLQAIFDAGNKEEQNVKMILLELGFEMIQAQMPFEIKNRQGEIICRGHIDGKIMFNGNAIPCEIKSMNPNIFSGINSLDDFQKKPHLRKYLRQMQTYLFGNNEEAGLFIISDFRHLKLFLVTLDFGECERILQRLERNWEMVKKKQYPEPIEYQKELCGRCSYSHLCLQPINNEGAKFIDNPELEAKLDRRAEIEPIVDEYESLDKEVKEPFKAIGLDHDAFVGTSWHIITKIQKGKRVDTKAMPKEIKEKYMVESDKVIVSIEKIK